MHETKNHYFVRVFCIFGGLGPFLGAFPLVVYPTILPVVWIVGWIPALLAAAYYFMFTSWWYCTRAPTRRYFRILLCGVLGAISGTLGILTFLELPILHISISKLLIHNEPFSLLVSVFGGLGSSTFIVWKQSTAINTVRLKSIGSD